MKHTIQHILWDWNGTLIDDVQINIEILNDLLQRYGLAPQNLQQYKDRFGFPLEDFYRELGMDFTRVSYQEIADEYLLLYRVRQFECSLHQDSRTILNHFRDRGMGQSILSAYHETRLQEVVSRFRIETYFEFMVGRSDHYAHSKLDQGRLLLAKLNLPPQSILMIGDTLHDAQVASALGVHCLLVADGHQSEERLLTLGIPVFENLKALYNGFNLVNT